MKPLIPILMIFFLSIAFSSAYSSESKSLSSHGKSKAFHKKGVKGSKKGIKSAASPLADKKTTGPETGKVERPMSQDPALRDLKAQFALILSARRDDTFTDPAVGGLSSIPLRVDLSASEGGP